MPLATPSSPRSSRPIEYASIAMSCVTEAIDERRPQHLQRPRQAEQAHEPDVAQRDAVHPEVHGQVVDDQTEGKALGEIEDGDPGELAPQRHSVARWLATAGLPPSALGLLDVR